MKYLRTRSTLFSLAGTLAAVGCANSHPSPTTVTETQFIAMYDDQTKYNVVAYMGSDDTYDYFCLEHVTLKPDGTDVSSVDLKEYDRTAMPDHRVKNPFPFTYDDSQWRIMRPKN